MDEEKKLLITRRPEYAAGMKAVVISMKNIFARMPKSKSFKVLNKLNKKEGLDCPGCAWPDPEHRSKLGEYCENGVKAIAEEAMDARATPDFFAKYSVEELKTKSDYWLGQQGRLTHPMILYPNTTHYEEITWAMAKPCSSKMSVRHSRIRSGFSEVV